MDAFVFLFGKELPRGSMHYEGENKGEECCTRKSNNQEKESFFAQRKNLQKEAKGAFADLRTGLPNIYRKRREGIRESRKEGGKRGAYLPW